MVQCSFPLRPTPATCCLLGRRWEKEGRREKCIEKCLYKELEFVRRIHACFADFILTFKESLANILLVIEEIQQESNILPEDHKDKASCEQQVGQEGQGIVGGVIAVRGLRAFLRLFGC